MADFRPRYLLLHDYDYPEGRMPKNEDGMFNPYNALVFPDGSVRYRNKEDPYGRSAPQAFRLNDDSVGLSYMGRSGETPTEAAMKALQAEVDKVRQKYPDIKVESHGQAYERTKGTAKQASRSGRGLDEASWRVNIRDAQPVGYANLAKIMNPDGSVTTTAGWEVPKVSSAQRFADIPSTNVRASNTGPMDVITTANMSGGQDSIAVTSAPSISMEGAHGRSLQEVRGPLASAQPYHSTDRVSASEVRGPLAIAQALPPQDAGIIRGPTEAMANVDSGIVRGPLAQTANIDPGIIRDQIGPMGHAAELQPAPSQAIATRSLASGGSQSVRPVPINTRKVQTHQLNFAGGDTLANAQGSIINSQAPPNDPPPVNAALNSKEVQLAQSSPQKLETQKFDLQPQQQFDPQAVAPEQHRSINSQPADVKSDPSAPSQPTAKDSQPQPESQPPPVESPPTSIAEKAAPSAPIEADKSSKMALGGPMANPAENKGPDPNLSLTSNEKGVKLKGLLGGAIQPANWGWQGGLFGASFPSGGFFPFGMG